MEKELIEQITVIATETATKILVAQKELESRAVIDRRLRNTKLLLKNFRHLKAHANSIRLELDELDELLILDSDEMDEIEVESIKKSKRKTLIMLAFISHMLELYRTINEKRHMIVVCLYIADEKNTVEELAMYYKCTPRAIYKELKSAVSEISALFFGVDSILFQ
jgi:hypothetical protein